jgi:hypothetical protein
VDECGPFALLGIRARARDRPLDAAQNDELLLSIRRGAPAAEFRDLCIDYDEQRNV